MKQIFVIVVLSIIIIFGGIEFYKFHQKATLMEKNYETLKNSKTVNDTNYITITNKVDSINWQYKDSTRYYEHTDTIIHDSLQYIYRLSTPIELPNYKLDFTLPTINRSTLITEYKYIQKNHVYLGGFFSFASVLDASNTYTTYYPLYGLDVIYQTKLFGYRIGIIKMNGKIYPSVGVTIKIV